MASHKQSNNEIETIHMLLSRDGKRSEAITDAQASRWKEAGFIERLSETDHIAVYQLHPNMDRDQL